jgi:transcriptional regulator GlxA family with amidase domain
MRLQMAGLKAERAAFGLRRISAREKLQRSYMTVPPVRVAVGFASSSSIINARMDK